MALTTLQTKIQTAAANAALKIAQVVGEQITYTPEGGSPLTLYAIVGRLTFENNAAGAAIGNTRDGLKLVIPKQASFPPATKLVDDKIVHDSITYRVTKAETDSVLAVYTIDATIFRG